MRPTLEDPVKATAATSGWVTSRRPASSPSTRAKVPGGCAGVLERPGDELSAASRQPAVTGMRLYDHRAAGSKGRGRIAAGDAESEGKIAGSEDRHGPERPEPAAQLRTWPGRPARVGRVDADLEEVTLLDHPCQETELESRPGQLRTEPGHRQVRLCRRQQDELVGARIETVGYGTKHICSHSRRDLAPRRGSGDRPFHHVGYLEERRLESFGVGHGAP